MLCNKNLIIINFDYFFVSYLDLHNIIIIIN